MIAMSRKLSEFVRETQRGIFGKQDRLMEEKFGVQFRPHSDLAMRIMVVFVGAGLVFMGATILYFLLMARVSR